MVKVGVWGSLKPLVGGDHVEVDARTLGELLKKLAEAHPGLKRTLDKGVSVSIDGRIYNDAWAQPIGPKSEVYLLPRLVGG
jgi:molybdopterin converting factor small subunit